MLRAWLSTLGAKVAGSKIRSNSISGKPDSRSLALESLEPRQMMAADVHAAFVASAYHMLLNRAPSAGDIAYWSAQYQRHGPQSVLSAIEASPEHQQTVVRNLYETVLGRKADAGGLTYWAGQLEGGAGAQQVKADMLGSEEFFQRAGDSSQSFLTDLYHNDLGRAPSTNDLDYWQYQLAAGAPRQDVAFQIIDSGEALSKDVQGAYPLYLGRSADPAALSYWVTQISGSPVQDPTDVMLAGLMASSEGVDRLSSFASSSTATAASDPNAVASAYLVTQFDSAWQMPAASVAVAGWSNAGYDPWLPTDYAQMPGGMSNWSSYVGIDPNQDAAFWSSIGVSQPMTAGRSVGTYSDATGYQYTPDTASSIVNYADGNRIRTFPGQYLNANGSDWGLAGSGSSSDSSGYANTQSITYDDNAPKGGQPGSYYNTDTSNYYGSYLNALGNGTDVVGGYEVPSSTNTWYLNSGTDNFGGQLVPSSTDTWNLNSGTDNLGGELVPY